MENIRELKTCNICNNEKFKVLHHYAAGYYNHNKYITHSWDGGLDIDLQIVKCKNCGLVYQNPCFNTNGLKYLYPKSTIPKILNYNDLMLNHKFHFLIDNIIPQFYPTPNKTKPTLADIGTRYGVLPELLSKKGFNAFGIEYNSKCVESARESGFKHIFEGTINNLGNICKQNSIKQINLVILVDVIEHLLNPTEDFNNISKLQQVGDRIIISTMNFNSLGYKLFKSDWYFIHSQHTYYFDNKSMTKFAKKIGYEIEYTFQIDKIKNITILPHEIKKYIKHKLENKRSKVLLDKKKWFATNRPSLFDNFITVLKKK